MTLASVSLWGSDFAAMEWDAAKGVATFEYVPGFERAGVQPAPIMMPAGRGVYSFPELGRATFKGLPGMLADSLPDKYGNLLIDVWLAAQGRSAASFNPVERLCYVGSRGMGALEFRPQVRLAGAKDHAIDLAPLVEMARAVLHQKAGLGGHLDSAAMRDILLVGTSAGGARAKAVLSWNPATGAFRSGQVDAAPGFEPWLLKLDGVTNRDRELADPKGFGRLEYACHLLARQAGVEMSDCRLFEEGGRAHFMTRRFDRTMERRKLHMQSLGALRHFDFNLARAYSYEQAVETARMLRLGRGEIEQMVLRALLNIVIRNQDDHVKNIAFLMGKDGVWKLAPAFDVVYAHNPDGIWTSAHQMLLNGKADGFDLDDLLAFGRFADIKPVLLKAMLERVVVAARNWPEHAGAAAIGKTLRERAFEGFRLRF